MRRRGTITAGLIGAILALPSAAQGAAVEVTASSGPAAEEYLEFRASRGEGNRVSVNITDRNVVIRDTGAKRIRAERTTFGACRATSRQRVVCPAMSVFVFLRDGNDRISFAPGTEEPESTEGNPFDFAEDYEDSEGAVEDSVFVDGGTGDDRIVGSRFDDFILPGTGRDKVFARGGPDWVNIDGDSANDYVRGGGGADALYTGAEDEIVDLAAGTLSSAGQSDSVGGFERVHTSGGADTLRGTDRAEALYGGGGVDVVDGRGGRDLLFGDSPQTSDGQSSANTIIGGDGDDFVDARSRNLVPTTSIDCGAGNDVFTGEVDDRPEPSCEQVAFRFGTGATFYEDQPDFTHAMRAFPLRRNDDGNPVYSVTCPPANQGPNSGCGGILTLSSPTDPNTSYSGISEFGGGPGGTGEVVAPLNAAGRAAVAAGQPVAVRVDGQTDPPAGSAAAPTRFVFGWQHVVAP